MNLSTKILIGLGLGIVAGLELGAEGVDFAKTWIGPFGIYLYEHDQNDHCSLGIIIARYWCLQFG